MERHWWWYRDVPQFDALGAKNWMKLLLNKMWEEDVRSYVDKMCEDALENYEHDIHNCTLGDIFDTGCPIPQDEGFFKELREIIRLYDAGRYNMIYCGVNHLYLILQDYIDDWNINGTDRCPLDYKE